MPDPETTQEQQPQDQNPNPSESGEGQESSDQQTPEAPQPVTMADLKSLIDVVNDIRAKVDGITSEDLDARDQDNLDRLWQETFPGSKAPTEEAEEDEPVTRRELIKFAAEQEKIKREIAAYMVEAELRRLRATYPDWRQNEKKILELAQQHKSLGGDDAYALWKAKEVGFENLSKREQTQAISAAKAAQDAKRAASEKPSASGTTSKREPDGWADASLMSFEDMQRKFGG